MPNTKDLELGSRLFCIFKGEPGSGKGTAAESFPEPYVMDLDGRIRSCLKMHPNKAIDYDQFHNIEQVLDKIERLTERCDYGTVHIASLTKLANMAVEYSMKHRGAGKGNDSKDLMRGKIRLTDVTDWGVEFRVLTTIVDALQKLKCHVILEAHVIETSSRNMITGATTVSRRLMTGAKGVAAYLPTCFDEAYHFYVESAQAALVGEAPGPPSYKCATQNAGEDWAKTALHLPPVFDWSNNNNFYELLQYYIKNPYVAPSNVVS